MSDIQSIAPTERYARAIAASKRIRWDIDNDVIRGRALDVTQKYLPDGLSRVDELPFLTAQERRFMSQVQGRTYANIFGLVERYINVKMLDRSRDHWFGDQVALEALVRFSDEELKHQELFRRVEALAARTMPPGYRLTADPNDVAQKYLPDGLSLVDELPFLTAQERRFMSQVQGRTYANIFGLVERYINVKMLDLSRGHWFGDQVALEALVRFSDEELKHQELFRRVEALAARTMPPGYRLTADPNDVARFVLGKSTWAVLGLTSHIEIFTQVHYKKSIDPDTNLSPLWKDVFFRHWQEESQHAILDELEWTREDAKLTDAERDAAVNDLIELVGAVDGILQGLARADALYFIGAAGRAFSSEERRAIEANVLKAYRWQYIVSGVQDGRFVGVLAGLVTPAQLERISAALAPLM